MSLKSIEMQVAIPRTKVAGHVQNQLNYKPAHDQAILGAQAVQHAERQRKRAGKVEESAEPRIREEADGKRRQQGGAGKSGKPKGPGGEAKAAAGDPSGHPYKGRHIDFSL